MDSQDEQDYLYLSIHHILNYSLGTRLFVEPTEGTTVTGYNKSISSCE